MGRDEQGRRMGRNFASLRATFSRHTAPVAEIPKKTDPVQTAPAQAAPPFPQPQKSVQPTASAEKRQSKYTLFDLFSKPKVERARGFHESSGLDIVPERAFSPWPSTPKQSKPQQSATGKVPVAVALSLRPTTPAHSEPQTTPPSRVDQPEYWYPPPLFQAYPQAVRHGSLQSPVVSTDSLARQYTLRKQVGIFGSTPSLPFVREDMESEQGQEAVKSVSRRFSSINDTPELTEKVFVLVTAGRLVQYAGDGNYDRMPEKVLQLGEKSAAYACDLIPGKHWTVQVVQQVNGDAANQMGKSRSILSRLRTPAGSRKGTTTFLIVFSSAEEMDAWLKAIRSVIEDMGGAKRKEDGEARVVKPKTEEEIIEDKSSHRFRASRPPSIVSTSTSIQRPSSSYSQPRSPRSPTDMDHPPIPTGPHLSSHNTPSSSPREAYFPEITKQSLVRSAMESSPVEASVASSDQTQPDRLSRNSVVSTRTTRTSETEDFTVPTSKCSSSPPSPHAETFPEPDSASRLIPLRTSYIASTSGGRRMSVKQEDSPTDQSSNVSPIDFVAEAQHPQADDHQEFRSKLIEQKLPNTPSLVLDNPRSRTSQSYSQTFPSRMHRPLRLSTDLKEPWNKDRPDSVVGQLPLISTRSLSRLDSVSKPRRPLSRMLPVRPTAFPGATDANPADLAPYPRRYSSMPITTGPFVKHDSPNGSLNVGTPLAASSTSAISTGTPSSTGRPRTSSYSLVPSLQTNAQQQISQARALRRPSSMQIRSDHAPFLSQRRTSVAARASAPSPSSNSYFAGSSPSNNFLPVVNPIRSNSLFVRAHSIPSDKTAMPREVVASVETAIATSQQPPPPIPAMNPSRPSIRPRTSMPAMMLSGLPPPPGLPPNMPLPSPPPPSLPPNMPLPSPPPNCPLPPPPMQAH